MDDSARDGSSLLGGDAASLVTTRLSLRPIRDDDREAFVALLGNPEVARYLGDGRPLDARASEAWLAAARRSAEEPHGGLRAVVWRGDGHVIGYCGIAVGEDTGRPELAYAFVPSRWGQGIATEAARAVLDHVDSRGAVDDALLATADPANAASLRLLAHLGFVETHRGPDVHGITTVFLRRAVRAGATRSLGESPRS